MASASRPDERSRPDPWRFYAHFDSREALVIEAFAYAMDLFDRALAASLRSDAAEKGLA